MTEILKRHAAWIAAALALAGVAVSLAPARPVRGFELEAFGRLPVLQGGRIKPLDTVARNALLKIQSKQSVAATEGGGLTGPRLGATEWLLDVMFRPDVADKQPAFVIDDPQVMGLLHLDQSTGRYHPFQAIAPSLEEIQREAMNADRVQGAERTGYQKAVLELFERVWLYQRLKGTIQVPGGPALAAEIDGASMPDARARQQLLSEGEFRPLPAVAGAAPDEWRSVGQGLAAVAGGRREPALEGWARLGQAWTAGDAKAFNAAVAGVTQHVENVAPAKLRQAGHELVFNRAQPFYAGMIIMVLALVTVFFSWLWPVIATVLLRGKPSSLPASQGELLRRAAFGFLGIGLLVQTAGLFARIVIQGRPPVTNLYSSAIFVGWAIVVLAFILEWMYRAGFATVVGGAMGFASLLVAHHLGSEGDTMEMMRAVLDSNFWLGTHVVTITIGYAGTFLAGGLAIAWVVLHHVLPGPDGEEGRKVLTSATYGVVCFALFFSFLGTVLGGIWADQSWGRFWGWDPKENGALLIVLWNAIILHARWGGYARDRGIMAMAIIGNVITSLSWFGVNMLGVGLHSYGFTDNKTMWVLLSFIGSQLVIVGFAYLPPLLRGSSPAVPSGQRPGHQPTT